MASQLLGGINTHVLTPLGNALIREDDGKGGLKLSAKKIAAWLVVIGLIVTVEELYKYIEHAPKEKATEASAISGAIAGFLIGVGLGVGVPKVIALAKDKWGTTKKVEEELDTDVEKQRQATMAVTTRGDNGSTSSSSATAANAEIATERQD